MNHHTFNKELKQWIMYRISAKYIQDRFPKFINAEECGTILSTPQTQGTMSVAV